MVIKGNEKEWLLEGNKTNGCQWKWQRMVVEEKENEWLLKQKKKNGC